MNCSRAPWLVLFWVLVLALPTIASAASFQLGDVQKLVQLSDPQPSPDGRVVAVVKTAPDWETDRNVTSILLVNARDGSTRTVTQGRTDVSSPRWSPDGTRLAFLADDPKTEQQQIYVMPLDGGDPRQVTDVPRGVVEFSWDPAGQRIAFITEDAPAENRRFGKHDRAFRVTDGHFLLRHAVAPWHLWVTAADGGKPTRLTEGDFSLQTEPSLGVVANLSPLVWTHDGQSVVFTEYPSPYWALSFRSIVASVGANGNAKPVTRVDAAGAFAFSFAPDGRTYAFQRVRDNVQSNGFAVYVGGDGPTRDATAVLARNFNAYAWLPNGRALILQGEDGTRGTLWEQPLRGAARRLDLHGVEASSDFHVARNGEIAFIGSTPTHASELYLMSSPGARPRRLTDVNGFMDSLTFGRTTSVRWIGPGGFHEDGVLTYPVGYHPGRAYPMVLEIHGGPEFSSTEAFEPLSQLLASAGFVVFQPNYRGSNNLGDAYQHAVFRDTGKGPGEDVMAGIAAVEKLGIVDIHRIGVSGWSYGGFMTAWLTSHYDGWRAAVVGAGLTDWVMDYSISFYSVADEYYFFGAGSTPWTAQGWDIWRDQSPLAAVRNVTAPTLIMGDVGDSNVPLVNGFEWYHALRDNGVPVEFWAYPVDSHFPDDVVQETDVYARWVGWMHQHLAAKPGAEAVPACCHAIASGTRAPVEGQH